MPPAYTLYMVSKFNMGISIDRGPCEFNMGHEFTDHVHKYMCAME